MKRARSLHPVKTKLSLSILVLINFISLTACNNSSDTNNGEPKLRDITDRSACHGPALAGNNITDTYQILQQSDSGNQSLSYSFAVQADTNNNTYTLTKTCGTPTGSILAASLTVPAAFTANMISLLSGGNKTQSDGTHSCTIDVQAQSIPYQFTGNCLQINYNGKSLTMIHR
jgi:hypothetical protein